MTLEGFINQKKDYWEELNGLLNKIQSGKLSVLSAVELERLGYLYRRVTSDLAIARRDFPHDRIVEYLNNLASHAHSNVYQSKPIEPGKIRHFFLYGFPELYREKIVFIAISFLLFAFSALLTFSATLINPDVGETVVPVSLVQTIKEHQMWTNIPKGERSIASSMIMTNNIQITFLAFTSGILFTLGTVYVLIINGMLIGAVGGLCYIHGLSLPLWSFVSPHGYIELSVIFIAGGAGIMMGYSLINPKLSTRKRALRDAAKDAVRLIGGCIPLLVIAGVIEGFISPSALNPRIKLTIGVATGILLYAYLFLSKKSGSRFSRLG